MKNLFLYFVKYPEPGKVKTRLAKTLGEEQAAHVYSKLAAKNYRRLRQVSGDCGVAVFYDPPHALEAVKAWLPDADFYVRQEGCGLGERMKHAVAFAFDYAEAAVLAGSDTLKLSGGILTDALKALERFDAVIGPAEDGGYYLFGMNEPLQSVFDDIDWSTEFVLLQTKTKLDLINMCYGELNVLADLDEWPRESKREDLDELIQI